MDYHEDAPKRCAHGWLVGRCPHPPCLNAPAAAVPEAQDGREAVLREAFIEAVLDQTVPQEIQDVGARQVKDVVTIAKWLAPAAVDWALDIAAALTPSAAVREQDADVRRGGFPEPEPVAYGWVMSRNAAGYPDEVRWLDPADVIIRRSAQDEKAPDDTVTRGVVMPDSPVPRPDPVLSQLGRLGAHTSWANTTDRTARTAKARAAAEAKFLADADGDPVRAAHLRKAHYARLALASARARRARKVTAETNTKEA